MTDPKNPEKSLRYYELDWLRLFAVFMLIPFHTARIFDSWPFYVKSVEVSRGLIPFIDFVNQWHMPLFFLLAGASSYFALQFRTRKEYVRERFKRLAVPLVFGTLVIIPPQSYVRLFGDPSRVWPRWTLEAFMGGPGYQKSYFDFYPDFFTGPFPNGNFEWGHLWFLAYLFVFSLLAVPIFKYLGSSAGKKRISQLVGLVQLKGGIFLLAVPFVMIELVLRGIYPHGNQNLVSDWANFLSYLTMLLYGYILFTDPAFLEAIKRHWGVSCILVLGIEVVLLAMDLTGFFRGMDRYSARWSLLMALSGFLVWCWMIVFIGFGNRFLKRGSSVLKYFSEAAR